MCCYINGVWNIVVYFNIFKVEFVFSFENMIRVVKYWEIC